MPDSAFTLDWTYIWLQVRAVPIRKDDEVQVVRGTYKVRLLAASYMQAANCTTCMQHWLLELAARVADPSD